MKTKRITALLMCLLTVIGLIPDAAFAAQSTVTIESQTNSAFDYLEYYKDGAWNDLNTPRHWIEQTGELDLHLSDVSVRSVKGHGDRRGVELDGVRHFETGTGFVQQFIRPLEHMLISALCTDTVGMLLPIREIIALRFALFRQPESQGVRGCLPCFICGESCGCVIRVAVHKDRIQTRQGTCRKDGIGRSCNVGIAVRVLRCMLHAVDDFARLLDPVFRCVEIVPIAVLVVLEVVERAVRLALDGDGRWCCKCCHGQACNEQQDAQQQCFDSGFVHVFFLHDLIFECKKSAESFLDADANILFFGR